MMSARESRWPQASAFRKTESADCAVSNSASPCRLYVCHIESENDSSLIAFLAGIWYIKAYTRVQSVWVVGRTAGLRIAMRVSMNTWSTCEAEC
jgi:hypothetical protein